MPAIVYLVMSMAVPLCFPATSATPATAFPFVPRPNIEYYRLGVVRPNDAGAIHIAMGILQSYGTLAAPRETLIVLRDPSTHKQSQFVIAPGAKLDGISLFCSLRDDPCERAPKSLVIGRTYLAVLYWSQEIADFGTVLATDDLQSIARDRQTQGSKSGR